MLPPGESIFHLTTDEERIPDGSKKSESNLIIDLVADESAFDVRARFVHELVTVMPGLEGAFFLYIGEVVVPLEFGDAGDPFGSDGEKRKDAERGNDGRADARSLIARYRWMGRAGARDSVRSAAWRWRRA